MLVRLFFAFGSSAGASASVASGAPTFSAAAAVVEVFTIWSDESLRLTDLRLRALAGDGGCAAEPRDSCGAVVAGCTFGTSAGEAKWAFCWAGAAMGEGLRLRLEVGEAL